MKKPTKKTANHAGTAARLEEIRKILKETESEDLPRTASELAKFKKLFFDELMGQGFTEAQAMAIVVASPSY